MKAAFIISSFLISTTACSAEIVGQGRNVFDGDTFDMTSSNRIVKVRICGIDAPESGQPGSKEAWAKLSNLVHQKTVNCVQVNSAPGTVCDGRSMATNRDRIVAQCFVNGQDIATELVKSGAACDWPKFSGGYYQRVSGPQVCVRN